MEPVSDGDHPSATFSSLLSATLLFQSLRNPPKGELVWIITGWLFILLALAGLAALHIHILYRYYPDRLIPHLLVTLRIIFTILSWVAVLILSLSMPSHFVSQSRYVIKWETKWEGIDSQEVGFEAAIF